MERLNSELSDVLKDLISMEETDKDVSMHIFSVSRGVGGSSRDRRNLYDLADLGYISINDDFFGGAGLTAKGRSYFKDLKEEKRTERQKLWGNRSFQISLSLITLILSGIISYIVATLTK